MTNITRVVLAVDSSQVRRGREELAAMQRAGQGAERSVSQINRHLSVLVSGTAIVMATRQVVAYADAWNGAANQLRQVTETSGELAYVQGQLLTVANETRSSFESTANLYSRLARSTTELGITQSELISLTTTINKSFAASGATAMEQAASITQLSQGLASGALRGDEFNSVAEQAPGLMRAIARETKMTIGELREFAATGGITAEIVVNALRGSSQIIDTEFGKSVVTFGQNMQIANNNIMAFVGGSGTVGDAVSGLGDAIVHLSKNLDDVADTAVMLGGVFTARFAGPAIASMTAATVASGRFYAAAAAGNVTILNGARAERERAAMTLATAEAMQVSTAATARATAADVAGYRATLENVRAELMLEQARHRAQINDVGRQASVRRMVAIRHELTAATAALTAAENAHAVATAASVAATTAATAAAGRLAVAQRAATVTSAALTFAMRGLSAAMAFLGGPVGVAITAAFAIFTFREELGLVEPEAQTAATGVDVLTKSIDGLTEAQKKLRLAEIDEEIRKQSKAFKDFSTLAENVAKSSGRVSSGKTVMGAGGGVSLMGIETVFTGIFDEQVTRLQAARDDARLKIEQLEKLKSKLQFGIRESANKEGKQTAKDKSAAEELAFLRAESALLSAGNTVKETSVKMDEARLRVRLASTSLSAQEVNEYVRLAASIRSMTDAIDSADRARAEDADQRKADIDFLEEFRRRADPARAAMQKLNEDRNRLFAMTTQGDLGIEEFKELEKSLGNIAVSFDDIAKSSIESLRTMQGVFERGSRGYAELEVAIQLANTALAVNAILNQAAGTNPYESFARMATMAAAVSSLVGGIGGLGGSFSDSAGQRQGAQGTGTTFGMWNDKSESIARASEITADATSELVGINRSMLTALQSLQQGITGASGMVAAGMRGASFNYGGSIDVNGNPLLGVEALSGNLLIDKMTGGAFSSLTRAIGKALGGSSRVTDQGVEIVGGTIAEMINDTMLRAYQETQFKKYAWSGTKTATVFSAVEDAVALQFSLVFESIADSVSAGAVALGMSGSDIEQAINRYKIETQKISLLGLDAEQQQKELNAVFSSIFDGLVGEVLPFVGDFQRIGEGMGETLARIATNAQVTEQAVMRLGISADKLGTEQFARLSTELIDLAGGLDSFIASMGRFVDLFADDSHKFRLSQSDLSTALQQVGLATPATREGMWQLMQTLDAGTASGREQIAALLRLSSTADTYYKMLEDAEGERRQRLQSEVSGITQAMATIRGQFAPTAGAARGRGLAALERAMLTGDLTGIGGAAQSAAQIDPGQFSTLAEFQAVQGRTLFILGQLEQEGSAQLSAGERSANYLETIDANIARMTMAATDSVAVTAGGSDAARQQQSADDLRAELAELKAYMRQVVVNSGESRDIIYRWNRDGIPEERDA